jgi:hypothetical protein
MAITKTDILNKALTLIGAAPVTNIDDDTNNARVLSRVYETALRSILSAAKWNFATKRATLTVVTDVPAWYDIGETYVYQKPVDIIRIFGTNDNYSTWREEGDLIFSDTSGLGIRYVYYLDVPSKYPSYFVDAFIDRLCADIAYMIVNSSTLGEKYKQIYEAVSLPKAQAADAQTGVQQVLQDDAWELSKYQNTQSNA